MALSAATQQADWGAQLLHCSVSQERQSAQQAPTPHFPVPHPCCRFTASQLSHRLSGCVQVHGHRVLLLQMQLVSASELRVGMSPDTLRDEHDKALRPHEYWLPFAGRELAPWLAAASKLDCRLPCMFQLGRCAVPCHVAQAVRVPCSARELAAHIAHSAHVYLAAAPPAQAGFSAVTRYAD